MVDLISPDGNILITDGNGAVFRPARCNFSVSSSDIVYGFNLSGVTPWQSSNANFSVIGTIDHSAYSVNNRPEKVGIFAMSVEDYNRFQYDYVTLQGYKAYPDIPDALLTAYNNQSTSSYRIYGAYVSTLPTFTFDFRVITGELKGDLALVFVFYSTHNNFCFVPNSLTLIPYSDSFQQMKDYQQREDMISQNQQQIEQNSDMISQNDEIIGSDEEGKESGVKGLLKKVKELPKLLADKIKELFVPSDEDVSDFQNNLKSLLSEHLGALYQSSDLLLNVLNQLKDFKPYQYSNCADYDFKIPAMQFFVNPESDIVFSSSDNAGSKVDLIPVGSDGYYHVDFSFLDVAPYKQIYIVYKGFVTSFFLFLAINFCRRKFNEIIGGSQS